MEGSCHRSGNATPPLVAVDLESTSLPTQDPIPTTNFDLLTSDEVVFCNDSMPTRAHSESEAQYQRIVSLPSPWRSKRGRTPASDGDVPVALENRGFIRPQQPESTNSTEASQIPERATTPHASQGWQHMAWRQRDVVSHDLVLSGKFPVINANTVLVKRFSRPRNLRRIWPRTWQQSTTRAGPLWLATSKSAHYWIRSFRLTHLTSRDTPIPSLTMISLLNA